MRIDGVDIEAVFGCVPANVVDNLAALEPLVGAEKAAATRRVICSPLSPPGGMFLSLSPSHQRR